MINFPWKKLYPKNRFISVSVNIQTKRSPYVIEGKINANKNHTRNSRGIPRGCSTSRRHRRTIRQHPKQGNNQPQLQPSTLIRKRQCTPIRHKQGYNQNGYGCYGYGAQTQNQNQPQYGSGMMGNGYRYGTLPVNQTATPPQSLFLFLFNRSRLIARQDAFGDFWRPRLPSSKPHLQLSVA